MIDGYDADFAIVDLKAKRKITDGWIASRCGWTPYAGMETRGWPVATVLRGALVMRNGEVTVAGFGQPLRFGE